MKKLNLLFIILAMLSCHKINDSDLTIVDKIVLGGKKENFFKQLDSLQVKSQIFYSKNLFFNINEINESKINFNYSEVFNTGDYNHPETSVYHYGLIYPIVNSKSNSNIIGMFLLLVNTSEAMYFPITTTAVPSSITKHTQILGVSQCIRPDLLDKIQAMLTDKYGQPSEIINSKDSTLYAIEKGSINRYISDEKYSGEIVKWKTKYLNISFFRGIKTNLTTFYSNGGDYAFNIFLGEKSKLDKNETSTFNLPYICYELNGETIKALKLNEVNL